MARIIYSSNAVANLARLLSALENSPQRAKAAADAIRSAIGMLAYHPFIGRIVKGEGDMRELVIGFGRAGYLALYEYVPEHDQVWVYAIRHQRELDYSAE